MFDLVNPTHTFSRSVVHSLICLSLFFFSKQPTPFFFLRPSLPLLCLTFTPFLLSLPHIFPLFVRPISPVIVMCVCAACLWRVCEPVHVCLCVFLLQSAVCCQVTMETKQFSPCLDWSGSCRVGAFYCVCACVGVCVCVCVCLCMSVFPNSFWGCKPIKQHATKSITADVALS